MREVFVTELVKEVLGPRGGLHESLDNSPLSEYITGVLAPEKKSLRRDPEAEVAELAGAGPEEAEEDLGDADVSVPPLLANPVLAPQELPRSMGISFAVEVSNGAGGTIDLCITWARYFKGENNQWQRKPRRAVLRDVALNGRRFCLDDSGSIVNPDERVEIVVDMVTREMRSGCYLVSIYLVNEMKCQQSEAEPGPVELHIFQPQVRAVCGTGVKVVPVDRSAGSEEDEETTELAFLYRERPVLARGHLCSAVWKDIDPERPCDISGSSCELPGDPPWHWVDGDQLDEDERVRFTAPDVRTEFVPLYSVPSPELGWDETFGPAPETDAEVLAETWQPEMLRSKLQPLVDGYTRWIESLRSSAARLEGRESEVAQKLISRCEKVRVRIQSGVDLLARDDEVRLAFCFAMKAMSLQACWPDGSMRRSLKWYPFQLAFILMALEPIANPQSKDREVCDLLWVPTGAGKTEAYLAVAAFTMAYRRRRARRQSSEERTGAGVAVISRYTLRLLTIQQFRRALKMVTACEYLRVLGLQKRQCVGWRPKECRMSDDFIWGSTRFSIGLWVGGGVTPNRLMDSWGGKQHLHGALSMLQGMSGEGEPAQVLTCPACDSVLAFSELSPGGHVLHYVVKTPLRWVNSFPSAAGFHVATSALPSSSGNGFTTLTLKIQCSQHVTAKDLENWWNTHVRYQLACAHVSRPGYFIRYYSVRKGKPNPYDFDIYCPNPCCPLHVLWTEGAPLSDIHATGSGCVLRFPDGNFARSVPEPFATSSCSFLSDRVPVPAFTVDDQVYHRCPSMVVATVDKFARLAFEPRCSALFGNVNHYHAIWGYYRPHAHPAAQDEEHPRPADRRRRLYFQQVDSLSVPDLILQDELHLIEGPLGSMVGIYETAVDYLCTKQERRPKYIASTATVRQATDQVRSLFVRDLCTFPAHGLSADDSFFLRYSPAHPLDDANPGRLYAGICAPGRGPLTPIVRMWARLLQTAYLHNNNHSAIDPFWTLVGYFNAIRELGGARALYRQDIPERIAFIAPQNARPLADDHCQELSSRTSSTDLPHVLDILNQDVQTGISRQDVLFTTSMFGTGIDIPRLGLMFVNGQPKSTSAYIQATGRVGRRRGALVVTFLRASRPRDLSHYEFFCGYHSQLHRFVEPLTAMPFSPGALARAAGPVTVAMLRNAPDPDQKWYRQDDASLMATRRNNPKVQHLPCLFVSRSQSQPSQRRLPPNDVRQIVDAGLDDWEQVARRRGNDLQYVEYAIQSTPQKHVVLGDPVHQHTTLEVVYPDAPQSLRDIEETCGFQT